MYSSSGSQGESKNARPRAVRPISAYLENYSKSYKNLIHCNSPNPHRSFPSVREVAQGLYVTPRMSFWTRPPALPYPTPCCLEETHNFEIDQLWTAITPEPLVGKIGKNYRTIELTFLYPKSPEGTLWKISFAYALRYPNGRFGRFWAFRVKLKSTVLVRSSPDTSKDHQGVPLKQVHTKKNFSEMVEKRVVPVFLILLKEFCATVIYRKFPCITKKISLYYKDFSLYYKKNWLCITVAHNSL